MATILASFMDEQQVTTTTTAAAGKKAFYGQKTAHKSVKRTLYWRESPLWLAARLVALPLHPLVPPPPPRSIDQPRWLNITYA